MKTNFKTLGTALLLCLLPGFLSAQEFMTGFSHGNDLPATAREVQVQTLPFYDDFSSSDRYPDQTRWTDRNAFVNAGFPCHPITRNAVTLDVLDANGEVYEYAISNPFIAERLTSAPIRLDSVFDPEPLALSPADSLYLSFFYQPQGNGNAPEAGDSLVLEFGLPHDLDTTWHHIWSTPGQTLQSFLQDNGNQYFKQVMIPIMDSIYFVRDFVLRFSNYASIAKPNQPTSRGNDDIWNIDAVYLNRNRSHDDTSYPKISFTDTYPNFLKRYRVMPYNHYCINPIANCVDYAPFAVSNLDQQGHNAQYHYTIQQVNGGQEVTSRAFTINLNAETYCQPDSIELSQLFAVDFTRDSTSFLIRHYLIDDSTDPPLVDSMSYHQGFYNYFAYDDGTPEMGYGVEPASAAFAVQFEMAEPDTLRGVQLLFNHTLKNANDKYFDIVVWKDNNGKPGDEVYRLTNRKPKWEDGLYQFAYYSFDKLIKLSGSFYVGIVQRDNGSINIGLDMSKDNSRYNFYNSTGSWAQSTLPGSLMIRPVVGRNYFIGVQENSAQDVIAVYPNPASTTIHITGLDRGASIALYDLTGRKVMQTAFTQELSVGQLSPGLYLLSVTNEEGMVFNKKICIKP